MLIIITPYNDQAGISRALTVLFPLVHRVAGVVVGPGQEDMRSQELVSGERLQFKVSRPFCRHPLLGCIDGSSVRRGQERVGRQIVTDDLQAASQKVAETGLG